jgi:3-hydroxyacyl-CoA dehydrogenase
MTQLVTVTVHGNIAALALNNPPVNALSHAARTELLEAFKSVFTDPRVRAAVIWCEGRTFIAGADIREFGKPPRAPDLPELVELIGAAPKLVIAAIHGSALGGGLELALACHFRVASPNAKLGLPEVTLGILPGAGGTQRLPRLVGVRPALEMIVGGLPVSASSARVSGLIDEIVEGDLKTGALAFAERVLADGRPLRRTSELLVRLDEPTTFADYEKRIAQRSRGFLAPFRCIDAVRAAVELPFPEGLERERELFRELMDSPESKAQRHAFFAEREVAKIPGLPEGTPTRSVNSVGVVGAGRNAREIAACFTDARIPVTLLAGTDEASASSLSALRTRYASAVARGRFSRAEADERLGLIRLARAYEDLQGSDLLIEAAAEDLDAKRDVLGNLEALAGPSALLATSSSSLDLDSIASRTSRPQDVIGLNFLSSEEGVTLLESVRGRKTAPDACATAMKLGRTLGKVCVPARGALASRLRRSLLREASLLLDEGSSRDDVDRALYDFGFPSGVLTTLEQTDPSAAHSKKPDVTLHAIAGSEILERCLDAIVNEGARALEERIAERPLDIDMIWIHAYGFPVYRGGPMFFADQVELRAIHERICQYQKRLGEQRWAPAPLIARLVSEGRGFYPQS